jgi:hypothetical protein
MIVHDTQQTDPVSLEAYIFQVTFESAPTVAGFHVIGIVSPPQPSDSQIFVI